ncbi:Rho GTPase activation protein [Zopfochytrium polystomum]|nr:Rho GTPase activation protein [Zopfochytrium polystomum]
MDSWEQRGKALGTALASKLASTSAVVHERSAVWREKASEFGEEVSSKAKEAYAAAKRSDLYQSSAAYITGGSQPIPPPPASSSLSSTATSVSVKDFDRDTNKRRSADALGYSVFGAPLDFVLSRTRLPGASDDVPSIVYRCIEYIEATAIREVGLYRVSGSASGITHLRNMFNINADVDLFAEQPDPNVVCSVLKAFLRELPEPLLTDTLSAKFQMICPNIEEANSPTGSSPEPAKLDKSVINGLTSLCERLPNANAALLRCLLAHLDKIQQHADTNKMTVNNLLVIFSPTLQISSTLLRILILNWRILLPTSQKSVPSRPVSEIRREDSATPISHARPLSASDLVSHGSLYVNPIPKPSRLSSGASVSVSGSRNNTLPRLSSPERDERKPQGLRSSSSFSHEPLDRLGQTATTQKKTSSFGSPHLTATPSIKAGGSQSPEISTSPQRTRPPPPNPPSRPSSVGGTVSIISSAAPLSVEGPSLPIPRQPSSPALGNRISIPPPRPPVPQRVALHRDTTESSHADEEVGKGSSFATAAVVEALASASPGRPAGRRPPPPPPPSKKKLGGDA